MARLRLDTSRAALPDEVGVVARERPFLGHLNLRGRQDDARFGPAVAAVLGMALPVLPNTVASDRDRAAYWLGPDEWLLVTPSDEETAVSVSLREALREVVSSITEVGSGQTVIVLQGRKVRELLAKECPLDLFSPSFGPGACAQTRLAKVSVLLRPLEANQMELIVRRSFAEYVWAWCSDAGAEYGFRAGP
ncbi:MAG: sarcosine oxidase subunit gamma family protein [Casimicrobiaceae bacterium]